MFAFFVAIYDARRRLGRTRIKVKVNSEVDLVINLGRIEFRTQRQLDAAISPFTVQALRSAPPDYNNTI